MGADGYKALIARRTYPQLSELIERAHRYYPKLGYKWEGQHKQYRSPEGGLIKFVSFQFPPDVENIVGHEYQFIGIDQVEQFTQDMVEVIETCARSSMAGVPARIRYTSNPGSVGHAWFKERFVDKCRPVPYGKPLYIPKYDITYQPVLPGKIFTDKNGLTNLYIPARVFDNPSLMLNDPKYVQRLLALRPKLRAAHLFGDYDTFVGQFFDMWNRDLHVVRPFEIPADAIVNWFGGYDWGYSAPSCYLQCAVMPNDDIFITREYYEAGKGIPHQAERIKKIEEGRKPKLRIADPQIWGRFVNPNLDRPDKEYPTDDTIQNLFQINDLVFAKANNNRINGWNALRELLEHRGNGRAYPRLRYFENCENCIRTIPYQTFDSTDVEDMDTNGEDHATDVSRYLAMAIFSPKAKNKEDQPDWVKHLPGANKKGRMNFA